MSGSAGAGGSAGSAGAGAQPRRAAVLGRPIAHSLSPALHRAAYAALGLTGWRYDAIEVDEAGLAGFLDSRGPEWAGLSLTMPLKRAVLPLLHTVSPLAQQVGAANTVVWREGRRHGENTDVPGMLAALAEAGVGPEPDAESPVRLAPAGGLGPAVVLDAAVVLGGGATATSAVAALVRLGVREPVVYARDPRRCDPLRAAAERLGAAPRVLAWPDRLPLDVPLVIATTPAGSTDSLASQVAASARGSRGLGVLFDVVYAPWPTPLAAAWAAASGRVVGGLDLLVHQAVGQVRLMTGREPPVAALRAAGRHALGTR